MTAGHGRTVIVAAAALGLAGCSLFAPPRPPPHAARVAPQSHSAPSAASSGSAAAAGALHHPAPAAPVQVIGLSRDAVRRLLGPPASQHAAGPAETWTYEGVGCRVEIAFYYDVTRSDFFALSQRLANGDDAQACLARIHDAHLS